MRDFCLFIDIDVSGELLSWPQCLQSHAKFLGGASLSDSTTAVSHRDSKCGFPDSGGLITQCFTDTPRRTSPRLDHSYKFKPALQAFYRLLVGLVMWFWLGNETDFCANVRATFPAKKTSVNCTGLLLLGCCMVSWGTADFF